MKFANLPFTCQVGKYGYNHQALIGSGIYSKVYIGKNIEQPAEVLALKVIENSLVSSPSLHQRVVDEVSILKKLNSKFLVKMVDILVTKHRTIIVQEFCSDGSLADILKKSIKISESLARKILIDICQGLEELVKMKILHRDLKPENILCNKNAQGEKVYKISDFSVSKQVTDFNNDPMLKTLCGTPLYNSPQILKKMEYSIKSDVWSLGLIYYQMLFGKLPWTPKSQADLIYQISNVPVTFPSTIPVTEESRQFILGCLQIDEAKRLNWTEIFSHPILKLNQQSTEIKNLIPGNDYAPKKIEENNVYVEYQANRLVKQIADMINNYCIDLDSMFKAYDQNNDQFFSVEEFHKFLFDIDEKIQLETTRLLFKKFDANSDGKISLQEFKEFLGEILAKLPETSKQISKEKLELDKKLQPAKKLSPDIEKSLVDLKAMVIKNSIDIKQIFKTIDTNKTGFLSYEQLQYFAKVLKFLNKSVFQVINARLSNQDIQEIFQAFDINNDGKLQFSEFSSIFQ